MKLELYQCDLCGKTADDDHVLHLHIGSDAITYDLKHYDICEDCLKRIKNFCKYTLKKKGK